METVKRHLFSDHLVDMINSCEGIAEYLEDWVEQIHQRYKKSISRGKMRDLVQQANYQCKQDKTYHHEGVKSVQKYVKHIRRRKFFNCVESTSTAQKKSDDRHARCLLAVARAIGLFDTHPVMKSPLERNLMEMRSQSAVLEAEQQMNLSVAETNEIL